MMRNIFTMRVFMAVGSVALLSCGVTEEVVPPKPTPQSVIEKDGVLMLPADYRFWPKFLSAVQRPDATQVREIYVNPKGARATQSQPFSNGTVFAMDLYKAQAAAEGLAAGPDGKLVKGELAKVFVMGKDEG
jgi:hemoglobin